MSLTPKAIIFGDEQGFSLLLKDFLFKIGLRDTVIAKDPSDLTKLINQNYWPIVLIDHAEGFRDGLAIYDGIFKIHGHELVPIFFVSPQEKKVLQLFGESVGAKGVITKPLQPNEALKTIRPHLPNGSNDSVIMLVSQVMKMLIRGEYSKAMPALARLETLPQFRRGAQIALARAEYASGLILKAEERLLKLHKNAERDILVMSELCEFYKRNTQYTNAIRYYQRVHSLHPQMTLKIWDQILLHTELDQIDEAAILLDELFNIATFKEQAAEYFARLMIVMGLSNYIPVAFKTYPGLLKVFNAFNSTQPKAPQ